MTKVFSRQSFETPLTIEQLFERIASHPTASFWLDSGAQATRGKSYLGFSDEVTQATDGSEQQFLDELRNGLTPVTGSGDTRFALGWIGWFSYEFGVALLGEPRQYEENVAPAVMMRVRAALEIDHETGAMSVIGEHQDAIDEWISEFAMLVEDRLNPQQHSETGSSVEVARANWAVDAEEYLRRIEACQASIAAGDAYLLCLTSRAEVVTAEHPSEVYLRLRTLSPTHHGGYLSAAGITLASASPEQFLSVNAQNVARTKPIKGTRPRGADAQRDEELRAELGRDQKELAENLMIVDLMRNDFSAVCATGTVHVTSLHTVETYEQVHQLVSTVSGTLDGGHDAIDLLARCFPAGSMTGAPKRRAVQLLNTYESRPRGVYSGCFGYFSNDGSADLAMVIRSIVFQDGKASVGSGGGITASSEPIAEIAEVELKAGAPLAALNATTRAVM